MDYKLVYTHSAEKDLEKLDKRSAIKVLRKMDQYVRLKNPLEKAKKLKGFETDTYRFRIGDYRALFRLNRTTGELIVLVVLKIAHRKSVYRS